jgi:hypothetical protein
MGTGKGKALLRAKVSPLESQKGAKSTKRVLELDLKKTNHVSSPSKGKVTSTPLSVLVMHRRVQVV